MLLAIDVGNTNTVLGVYQGTTLRDHWRIETSHARTGDEYGVLIRQLFAGGGIDPAEVDAVVISSVVPPLGRTLEEMSRRWFHQEPLFVGPGVKTGMPILYENPREVGADRVVNAVAAYERWRSALMVVDFGTATTFDAVSARGEYLGGAICPGVGISMEALFRSASKLPRVEFSRPPHVIGRNTVALHAGRPDLRLRGAGGRHLRAHGGGDRRVPPGWSPPAGWLRSSPGSPAPSPRSTSTSRWRGCASSTSATGDRTTAGPMRPVPLVRRLAGAEAMPDCPLPLDTLPKPLQKHADPAAPVPLRMMGAKGLVPAVAPVDLTTLLFILSFDADPAVKDTAQKTADGLPDKIWGVALRSEGLKPAVLDWLADRFAAKEQALELLLLNPATSDETVARLAPAASQRLGEIIRQNELRLLRHDAIIRALCQNPNALASTWTGPATSACATASRSWTSPGSSRRTSASTAWTRLLRRRRRRRPRPPSWRSTPRSWPTRARRPAARRDAPRSRRRS